MSGLGGCRDEVAVDVSLVDGNLDITGAGHRNIGAASWVGRAALARQDCCRRQELPTMTNRGDWFVGFCKVPDDHEDAIVQTNVFRSPAAGNRKLAANGIHFTDGIVSSS